MLNAIKKQSAFTLLEVLVVVGIMVIIFSASTSLLGISKSRDALESKAREVVSLIGSARDYASSGYLGDSWGIKVLDDTVGCDLNVPAAAGDCVVMFKGTSYASRTSGYDKKVYLNNGVYIGPSATNEFYFEYNSAWLSTSTGNLAEQGILLNSNSGLHKTVTTTPFGVTYFGD